jgi:hypothetical protein
MLSTVFELVCLILLSLFLFCVWPPAALLPWAAAAAWAAWLVGGWGRPTGSDRS